MRVKVQTNKKAKREWSARLSASESAKKTKKAKREQIHKPKKATTKKETSEQENTHTKQKHKQKILSARECDYVSA